MLHNLRKSLFAISVLVAISLPALAAPITANIGWVPDTLNAANAPTDGSPFTFSLTAGQSASFKLTDQFAVGDSFQLFSGGALLASSTAYAGTANATVGEPFGEAGWLNAAYEKIDYVFSGAGAYSFSIEGDGAGGVPAGLYVRLDVTEVVDVPEPTSFALLGLGLVALSTMRRRKA